MKMLVQLPLPNQLRVPAIIEAIAPGKDVDGLHKFAMPLLLASGDTKRALSCLARRPSMVLLDMAAEALGVSLAGAEAVVIGRSNQVATICCSRPCGSNNPSAPPPSSATVARADIVVAAVGRPWIQPEAIVINISINRVAGEGQTAAGQKTRLVGDRARPVRLPRCLAVSGQ